MSENPITPAGPPARTYRPIPVFTGDGSGPGAPSKLTEDLLRCAVEAMNRSLYMETVADLLGIDRNTLRAWLKRGAREQRRRACGHTPRSAEDIYLRFNQQIRNALAQTTVNLLDTILQAAQTDPKAATWLLERRSPDLWGRDRHEILELKRSIKALEARIAELSPSQGA